jgi:hypothetical protein
MFELGKSLNLIETTFLNRYKKEKEVGKDMEKKEVA